MDKFLEKYIFNEIDFQAMSAKKISYFLTFAAFFLTIFFEPKVQPDSITYIEMLPSRSPVYPLLLNFFKTISDSYFMNFIVFTQFLFWFFSVLFFIKTINQIMKVNILGFILLIIIFIVPSFYFSPIILTESFAFSLTLIIISLILKGGNGVSGSLSEFLLFIILCLMKPQMLFLSGVFFFIIIRNIFNKKIKNGVTTFCLLLSSLIIINLSNKCYHLIVHNKFQSDTNLIQQFVAMPFYMTDPKSDTLFLNEPDYKEFFFTLSENLNKKNINFSYYHVNHTSRQYWPKNYLDNYAGFVGVLNNLKSSTNSNSKSFEAFLGEFSKALVIYNLEKNPLLFLKGYMYNFSINGFYTLYLALIFMILTMSFFLFSILLKNKKVYFISIFLISHFSNIFVVSLIEPVINRYRFFTEVPLLAILMLILINFLTKSEIYKNRP